MVLLVRNDDVVQFVSDHCPWNWTGWDFLHWILVILV